MDITWIWSSPKNPFARSCSEQWRPTISSFNGAFAVTYTTESDNNPTGKMNINWSQFREKG